MSKKQIILNAFNMNCVGHINHGLWTHPRDRSTDYRKLSYWTDLAKLLERGLFDGLFIADIVGVYDIYQQSVDVTLKDSVQLPVNDPMMLVSAMAAATQHLGFGITVNLTYEAPYLLARRFSTLDHLTDGRIGWNIVTGYLDSAARAMGHTEIIAHDERYDRADEYLDVLYKLWEGSWQDDAVLRDRDKRVFADPAKVRKLHHHGRYYDVEGYHLSEPSPQRTPVLFQAGSSGRGQAFAVRHAECVFVSSQSKAGTRKLVDALRAQAAEAGRDPRDLKIIMGITVVVGRTQKEAEEKFAEYARYASPEAGLAHFSAGSGIDYSTYAPDDELAPPGGHKGRGIESSVQRATDGKRGVTVRHLLEQMQLGGRYTTIVGDPLQVADALQAWVDEADIDGFNLARTLTPESYEDFIELVIPELQSRGIYKTAYAQGTLRDKLFGNGARLGSRHTGASFRNLPDVTADVTGKHAT
ncbi:LLM class flavin-dependent oxidoreductase [Paraburkholderia sp. MMS20-SJTN17]|uniref:LLM class flavin-dependent oxidoreductase n=1 Tax=Paraburkholderia translucens TaxID=2886945 RepID=A0ABS8KKD0_9BURK|nr:LLM class flavin-dependent oxidoreductase [Paraburkholderia sp. MMS20-SJTN17]MCC8405232.1 LLM class flavin-dependent oxidoreductase [Paraburkholderia sp. MMS20-SJTN17]